MNMVKVDWMFINYSGVVYCFVEFDVNSLLGCLYNLCVVRCVWNVLDEFFEECFECC